MKSFDLSALLLPGFSIWVLTLAVSLHVTRNALAGMLMAFIKAALFIGYFGFVFDGSFTFFDDWTYLEGGIELIAEDVGIFDLPSRWDLLPARGGGDHFLYYLYNAYALRLFGPSYFAPVACNVMLTLAVAALGANLARRELYLSRQQARWLYVALLLHPDILAWSTVANLKDIATLLMHTLLLQAVALFLRDQRYLAALIAAPVCVALAFMRFYVPFMFIAALLLSSLLARAKRGHAARLLFTLLLLGTALLGISSQFNYALDVATDTFVNPLFGFARVTLTPIPFHMEDAYAFLEIPAIIHWLLLPFAIVGLIAMLRMRTPYTRFFVIYLLLFLCLYAVVGELQGPRHRVQLDYAIALLQFLGVLRMARKLKPANLPHAPRLERASTSV